MSKNIFISLLSLFAIGLFAMKVAKLKYNELGDRLFTKAQCISDLNQIAELIKNTHPAPFDYISKEEFDALHKSQIARLQDENTLRDFHWNARKLIASIGCGHTSLTGQLDERRIKNEKRFPLNTRFIGDRLFLISDFDRNDKLTTKTEILSINGEPTKDILYSMMDRVSVDGLNQSASRYYINREVDFFLSTHFQFTEKYNLQTIQKGLKNEISIPSGVKLWNNPADAYNAIENLSFKLDTSNQVALLSLRSFNYYGGHLSNFNSFIDSSMQQLKQSNFKNLVIDIRGNGGGNPYCANHLLKYISSKPYQYFDSDILYYDDLKTEIKPFEDSYKGEVYMIIDGGCGSTSGHLVSLVRYNQVAILVGQTAGATYKCHDNSSDITLRNTRLNLHIARNTYKTAVKGMKVTDGVIPDLPIDKSLEAWIYNTDNVLDSLHHIILN